MRDFGGGAMDSRLTDVATPIFAFIRKILDIRIQVFEFDFTMMEVIVYMALIYIIARLIFGILHGGD